MHRDLEGGESFVMLSRGEFGSTYMGICLLAMADSWTTPFISELYRQSHLYVDPDRLLACQQQYDQPLPSDGRETWGRRFSGLLHALHYRMCGGHDATMFFETHIPHHSWFSHPFGLIWYILMQLVDCRCSTDLHNGAKEDKLSLALGAHLPFLL